MRERLTVLVSGMLAGVPGHGGASWVVLQYLHGLRRLGHDVHFVEAVDASDDGVTPSSSFPLDVTPSAAYFRQVTKACGLEGRATLLRPTTGETVGRSVPELRGIADRADVLLNLSGMLQEESLLARIPVRVYVDLDPAFTQLWHAVEGIDMGLELHTHFATVGLRVGSPGCRVPTCGREWIRFLPPVDLAHWPVARGAGTGALTTVANWRGYGSIRHDGVHYGQKAHSLRPLVDLPRAVPDRFVLALCIGAGDSKDRDALEEHGWQVVSPVRAAGTPGRYRAFVRRSRAEFGVAKSGYVESRSGWFSDRSACYLASGRPVVAQDTGFSEALPTGEGLFSFRSGGEVVEALEALRGSYERHARAARELAEEHLESGRVLRSLLEQVGGTGGGP